MTRVGTTTVLRSIFHLSIPDFPKTAASPRTDVANMAQAEEVLIVKGTRIVFPDSISSGCIIVKNGTIVGIERSVDTKFATSGAKVRFVFVSTPTLLFIKQNLGSLVSGHFS